MTPFLLPEKAWKEGLVVRGADAIRVPTPKLAWALKGLTGSIGVLDGEGTKA